MSFQTAMETAFLQISDLKSLRSLAWDRFQELGLPDKKNDQYRYVKLRTLYENLPEKHVKVSFPEEAPYENSIVFVNGYFSNELSNVPYHLNRLDNSDYSTFIAGVMQQSLGREKDPFVALNAALHFEGAFLYVPPKSKGETLHIVHVATGEGWMMPRLHVSVGAGAEINFKEHYIGCEDSAINTVLEFSLEKEAKVTLSQNAVQAKWHLEGVRATLKEKAYFKTVQCSQGTRHDYHVVLAEPEANVELLGLSHLKNTDEAHVNVLVEHAAPRCLSSQLFKNICDDASHASFEGKIYVHQAAQQTEAYQKNENLILGEHARAESKPNLEIFADDVKASHGATFGEISKEQMLYLMTRGLSEEESKNLLIRGFCEDILCQM